MRWKTLVMAAATFSLLGGTALADDPGKDNPNIERKNDDKGQVDQERTPPPATTPPSTSPGTEEGKPLDTDKPPADTGKPPVDTGKPGQEGTGVPGGMEKGGVPSEQNKQQ